MHIYEVQDSNITNSYKQPIRFLCSFGAYETKTALKQTQFFLGRKWFKSIRRQASDHLAVTVPSDTDTSVNFFFLHSPAANWRDLSTDNDIDTDSATDAVWQSFGKMLCCLSQALYWESAMIVRSAIVLEKCYVALVIHCIWKIWALNYYGKCLVHRYVIAPDVPHTVIYISSHYHQWLAK